MNKINWKQKSEILEIPEGTKEIHISSSKMIKTLVFPKEEFSCTIVIHPHVNFSIQSLVNLQNVKGKITIMSTSHSVFQCFLGIMAKENNELSIWNIVSGNENESKIQVRVVGEENSHTIIKTTGHLKKDTSHNVFLEEVKYLNETQSFISCIPNLFVDSNDVTASHNVTIGCITEEELFYLETKGIERNVAKKLIRDCFLKKEMR